MTVRSAALGALLALPLALLALAPGARFTSLLSTLPIVAGLLVLDGVLRRRVADAPAFWTLVIGSLGTSLFPLLAHASDPWRALAFALGATSVALAPRWPAGRARQAAFVALTLAGLALGARARHDDLARGLFGSRDGLLYWSPVLWLALLGALRLWRREEREAAHLVAVAVLPFAAAPFLAGLDAALPAQILSLGMALDAVSRAVARRPVRVLWAALPLLAVSNLLFMEQYRYTLKRDDTVSFPQVSEGNARLFARAVGSPNAWPANWLWSARHDLPVERWDLVSGQRLQPGATVDVGDLEQDAAFLLDGWSVRHACGDAICREVEGRAEMLLPLEGPAEGLALHAVGPGGLRVAINGTDAGAVPLGSGLQPAALPAPLRAGMNRISFEAAPGTSIQVDRVATGKAR